MSRAYGCGVQPKSRTESWPLGAAYPLANQMAAEIVLGWSSNDGATVNGADRRTAGRRAGAAGHDRLLQPGRGRGMCAAASPARTPALDEARGEVEERYVAALSRGITTRQLASVRTMLRFFRTLIPAEHPDGKLDEESKQLEDAGSGARREGLTLV